MSEDNKRKGNKLYLIGFSDFKTEINAGPEKVKKWKSQGAPISNYDNTYRAKTEDILDWLLLKDQENESVA